MRLKSEKIEYLARKIVQSCNGLKTMQIVQPEEAVTGVIKRVIIDDLRREDELEKEAEQILKQYRMKISLQNLSYSTLLTKTKQQLARDRKIVL
ncbi:MAG: DUF507 family protein [bacterium]|nr:DUF507 family protein [Candidatus Sumerlaeota bacterium]